MVFSSRTPLDDYPLAATTDAYLARATCRLVPVAQWYADVVRLGFAPRLALDGEQYIIAVIRRGFPSGAVARVFAMANMTAIAERTFAALAEVTRDVPRGVYVDLHGQPDAMRVDRDIRVLRRLRDSLEWPPCIVTGRHTVVEGSATPPELAAVRRVHSWFDRSLLGRTLCGRPVGSDTFGSRGVFLRACLEAAARARDDDPNRYPNPFTIDALVANMQPMIGERTLRDAERRYGFAHHSELAAWLAKHCE